MEAIIVFSRDYVDHMSITVAQWSKKICIWGVCMEGRREHRHEFKASHFLSLLYVVCCWAKADLLRVGFEKTGVFPFCVPMKCFCRQKKKRHNWITGQAREEGREWFLTDRLPRFFQGCERTWSETNLPKIMHCGCSVLAWYEAVTLCCADVPKELLKQGPSLGGSWLSLLLICHSMSHA